MIKLDMTDLKPSDFAEVFPWGSALQENETEIIAQNIMVILKRTGDTWRELELKEYRIERLKDVEYSSTEEDERFSKVINYCKSPDTAILFSPAWKKVKDDREGQVKAEGNYSSKERK